jgi:hypothetical protein
MKISRIQLFVIVMLSVLYFSCSKAKGEKTIHGENYIQNGNEYFQLDDALAVYDNTDPNATHFTLELSGNKNDLVVFDYLLVPSATTLPEGEFPFHKAANSQDLQTNKYNDLYLRTGKGAKTIITPQETSIQNSSLLIKKLGSDTYQIKGVIKTNATTYEVSYTGQLEHMEAW